MQRERRLTKGETPEAPTKKLVRSLSDFTSEDRLAAFCAGLEQGRAERVELAIEDQVRARLYQLSQEALGMARRSAQSTGPAWASLIHWAGSTDD